MQCLDYLKQILKWQEVHADCPTDRCQTMETSQRTRGIQLEHLKYVDMSDCCIRKIYEIDCKAWRVHVK